MSKLVLIFLVFFYNSANAHWIIISSDSDNDSEFSYQNKDIEKHEGKVKLWVRQKTTNEATKSQIEINCEQNTVTLLIVYFFNDRNWEEQGKINDVPHTAYIPVGSGLGTLATDLCE
tara:strand:+ start:382 stop:732 length:351 start_codon:yes stop_codon:yes gene_type:complete